MKTFVPQHSIEELAPNPHCVELVGAPESLAYPPICASCGAHADGVIRIEKAFYTIGSVSRRRWENRVAAISAPFCARCIAEHAREARPISPLYRIASRFMSEMALPTLGSAVIGLFLLPHAIADIAHHRSVAITGGAALFFFLVAWGSYAASVSATAARRVPPQTNVTLAFDFSDDLSQMFDAPRRVYAIRNAEFAEQFIAMNRARAWDPASARAIRADRTRTVIALVVVGAVVVLGMLVSLLHSR